MVKLIVVVMQLFQKYWINLFKHLENKKQLFVVSTHEFIATEACSSINDEVVLFLVELVILILIGVFSLESIPDNKSHKTE